MSKQLPWHDRARIRMFLREFPIAAALGGICRHSWTLAICGILVGCQTPLDVSSLKDDPLTEELARTDHVKGPLERVLPRLGNQPQPEGTLNAAVDQENREAMAQYRQAQDLFERGEFEEAEKQAKRISKQYKDTPVREDALYLLGEAQFAQERFAKAQDSFETLLNEFPSSRYMDRVTGRMFAIAQTWLGFPQMASTSEIQEINYENPSHTKASSEPVTTSKDPTLRIPILPNFHDRSRPIFDTHGRALVALKSIWLNDPTGPLADDALMLTASYYLRKGDYIESDRYFQILREEYPKSPHLEDAFVLGSHVKLMSYQGDLYDGTGLTQAREMKESTLRLFPDNENREQIRQELSQIDEAAARRDWALVEFYRRKNRPQSMAVYCMQIIERFPQTSYAALARETLAEIGQPAAELFPEAAGELIPIPELVPVPESEAASEAPPAETSGRATLDRL